MRPGLLGKPLTQQLQKKSSKLNILALQNFTFFVAAVFHYSL